MPTVSFDEYYIEDFLIDSINRNFIRGKLLQIRLKNEIATNFQVVINPQYIGSTTSLLTLYNAVNLTNNKLFNDTFKPQLLLITDVKESILLFLCIYYSLIRSPIIVELYINLLRLAYLKSSDQIYYNLEKAFKEYLGIDLRTTSKSSNPCYWADVITDENDKTPLLVIGSSTYRIYKYGINFYFDNSNDYSDYSSIDHLFINNMLNHYNIAYAGDSTNLSNLFFSPFTVCYANSVLDTYTNKVISLVSTQTVKIRINGNTDYIIEIMAYQMPTMLFQSSFKFSFGYLDSSIGLGKLVFKKHFLVGPCISLFMDKSCALNIYNKFIYNEHMVFTKSYFEAYSQTNRDNENYYYDEQEFINIVSNFLAPDNSLANLIIYEDDIIRLCQLLFAMQLKCHNEDENLLGYQVIILLPKAKMLVYTLRLLIDCASAEIRSLFIDKKINFIANLLTDNSNFLLFESLNEFDNYYKLKYSKLTIDNYKSIVFTNKIFFDDLLSNYYDSKESIIITNAELNSKHTLDSDALNTQSIPINYAAFIKLFKIFIQEVCHNANVNINDFIPSRQENVKNTSKRITNDAANTQYTYVNIYHEIDEYFSSSSNIIEKLMIEDTLHICDEIPTEIKNSFYNVNSLIQYYTAKFGIISCIRIKKFNDINHIALKQINIDERCLNVMKALFKFDKMNIAKSDEFIITNKVINAKIQDTTNSFENDPIISYHTIKLFENSRNNEISSVLEMLRNFSAVLDKTANNTGNKLDIDGQYKYDISKNDEYEAIIIKNETNINEIRASTIINIAENLDVNVENLPAINVSSDSDINFIKLSSSFNLLSYSLYKKFINNPISN